ncbi:unnamed protein product [Paramecium sonneborni]|uniref:Uncharacterized protein n=1 Tax=Paramecium sonneborni TaxID=65129 RepID=A0A8S1KP76_9CILI|nr:unnamed protein product [Paramecium sonneborni]
MQELINNNSFKPRVQFCLQIKLKNQLVYRKYLYKKGIEIIYCKNVFSLIYQKRQLFIQKIILYIIIQQTIANLTPQVKIKFRRTRFQTFQIQTFTKSSFTLIYLKIQIDCLTNAGLELCYLIGRHYNNQQQSIRILQSFLLYLSLFMVQLQYQT